MHIAHVGPKYICISIGKDIITYVHTEKSPVINHILIFD